MPTIFIIDSIKIFVYFDDHNPPHFHAIYNDYEELIIIPSLETLRGSLPPARKRKVIDWAIENMNLIVGKWNEFNRENRL
jgi:hypothetical protein